MDKFYVYRPFLDLVGFTEGTDKGRGYNETLSYGAFTGGPVDLVSMTLNQIDQLQTKMLQHPKNKFNSSAAGRYQIVRTTRRDIQKALRLDGTLKFDKDMQDRMGCYLLGVRGIDKYLSGRLSEDTLINNLAQEWASLPTTKGKGHFDGQNAAVGVARVRSVLAEVKRRHAEGQPVETVEVEKPVMPPQVEKEVRQKTNWFTSIFGAGGIMATFGAWAAGLDHEKLLIIAAIVVFFGLGFLLLGEWIVRRVRKIRKALEE
jgi:Muramidase (phage lambda lysozyme)